MTMRRESNPALPIFRVQVGEQARAPATVASAIANGGNQACGHPAA